MIIVFFVIFAKNIGQMKLTKEELQLISTALTNAQSFLYNEIDVICDDDYREETENVLECIYRSIAIVDKYLYNKQYSL